MTHLSPSCLLFTGSVLGVQADDPLILSVSLVALLVGLVCGLLLVRGGARGESAPFFGFALMMTEAGLTHAFARHLSPSSSLIVWLVDAVLTSSIALAFGVIGLVDAGLLSPKRFYLVLALADVPVILGWTYSFLHPSIGTLAFRILYLDLILVTCGFFAIVQLVGMIRGRFHGVVPLLVAVLAGMLGLLSIRLCSWPDVRFSGEFWWFLFSDVSMLALFFYFRMRSPNDQQVQVATHV